MCSWSLLERAALAEFIRGKFFNFQQPIYVLTAL
jgi:hypothetical protein